MVLAAAALALAPAAALGLARFGYALLLPSMRESLGWSYFEAGTLNTANALGYVVGALVAARAGRQFGAPRALVGSLAAVVLSVFICAASGSLLFLCASRVVAGIGGGVIYVVGGGLAAQLGRRSTLHASRALSIYFGGVGAGILLSGLVIPEAIAGAPGRWRIGWVILGIGALASLVVVGAALRRSAQFADTARLESRRAGRAVPHQLAPTFLAYGLEGIGYIAYMTFAVALIRTEGASPGGTALFWSLLGVGAMISSPLVAPAFAGRLLRGGRGVAAAIAVAAVASFLPVISSDTVVLLVSATVFGGSFIAVATVVALLTREALAPQFVTAALGQLTVVFALGQVVGPVLAGSISDTHAGLRLGLACSSAVLAIAAPVALAQRLPGDRRRP